MSEAHPVSTFELDCHFADPAGTPAETVLHVSSCHDCASYLAELERLGAAAGPTRPLVAQARPRWRRIAPWAATLSLAAAFVVYLGVADRPSDDTHDAEHYVGVKGVPATQLLVRRAGATRLWQDEGTIRARDSLAFQVACEHLAHVTVAADTDAGLTRYWEGECPAQAMSLLPFTLVVDAQPGQERFAVVLSRAPLDDAHLLHALRTHARTDAVWTTPFELRKEP